MHKKLDQPVESSFVTIHTEVNTENIKKFLSFFSNEEINLRF